MQVKDFCCLLIMWVHRSTTAELVQPATEAGHISIQQVYKKNKKKKKRASALFINDLDLS